MRIPKAVSLVLLVLLAACGADKGVTDPVTNLQQGSMSAKIDGANWSAAIALSAGYSGNLLAFAGSNTATTIGMAIAGVTGPGTYLIGPAAVGSNALVNESSGKSWHALSQTGSGTIVVTSLSATAVAGTFSFTAPAVAGSGATGTKVVTEGRFNLKF